MPTNLIQYSMETNFKTQLLFFKTYKYLKIINGGGGRKDYFFVNTTVSQIKNKKVKSMHISPR